MAEKFDVPSRLAEGRPAVDNIQTFVWACHLLGYQSPDLTLHAAQIRDWYTGEDGMDLRALDADRAALEAAVAATGEALARQDDQLVALSAAWQGRGADASSEFLRRHAEASATAANAVRTAADALAALRDDLWHTVDGKVVAALAIDDRTQAQRADWLTAAHTVTTGAGDRAAASELIDQQVKPFVDNDIRADWLTAMRSTTASVADSYVAATAELTAEPDAVFDVPGDLGPAWTPRPREDDVATTTPASVQAPVVAAPPAFSALPATAPMPAMAPMPAALQMPAAPPELPPPAAAPPSAPMPPMPSPAEPAMPAPAMPSLGGMGGGLPDIGSGLSGFGQQLADTLGGLFGSAGDGLELDEPDIADDELDDDILDGDSDDPEDDTTDDEDPIGEPEPAAEPVEEPTEAMAAETAETCEQPAEAPIPVEPPLAEPAPTPAPVPPPEPPSQPSPAETTGTPCEIAATELPQVGP